MQLCRSRPYFLDPGPGVGAVDRTPGREDVVGGTAEKGYLHCGPTPPVTS